MKMLKKVLFIFLIVAILLSNQLSYATTTAELDVSLQKFELWKYVFIGVAVVLILLIFVITYKMDKSKENAYKYDDEKSDEDEPAEVNEDQSLYSSFEMDSSEENDEYEDEEKLLAKDDFTYEDKIQTDVTEKKLDKNMVEFQLDEIFDDEVPEVENKEKKNIEQNESNLDEDFLRQMNQNLGGGIFSNKEESIDEIEQKTEEPKNI